jgi:hypothetical protein
MPQHRERLSATDPATPPESEPRPSATMLVGWFIWLTAVWVVLVYAAIALIDRV